MPARRSPSLRTSHENLEQTDMTEPSDGSALEATVESERFDQISITLHWLTALLIIVMFATAWSREAVDHDTRLASALMTAHRTTGVVTWIVGWVRLVWRYNFAYLPPFPERMPKLQQWVAKANEYGLYALLLVQPLSGLGNVLFRGHSFSLFIWEMPALFEANPAIRSVFVEAHELGANALLTLIGLHASAALFHRLVLRDGVLQRMLPWPSASAPVPNNKLALIAQYMKNILLSLLAHFKVTAPASGQDRGSHSH
jgi:superoxide oxidase